MADFKISDDDNEKIFSVKLGDTPYVSADAKTGYSQIGDINSKMALYLNESDGMATIGDAFGADAATRLVVNTGSFKSVGFFSGLEPKKYFEVDVISQRYGLGDLENTGCNTNIKIDDEGTAQTITLNANNGVVVSIVQEFSDNDSAIAGGLVAGTIYRTGDDLKIVH